MIFRPTDEELLAGLLQQKNSCIDYLYREYGPVIRHFIRQNSGNAQDVEDIMQDTIIKLFQVIRNPSFRLSCSLKTYFIAISRKLWMQRLDRKYRLLYQADFAVHEPDTSYMPDELDKSEQYLEQDRLFFKHLSEMPNECRRLLDLYFLKIPYKEIARLMNYKDDVYVKTRKYYCKNLLRKRIMKDPDYQLISDYHGITDFE